MKAYVDPYIDKKSGVLKNKFGLKDSETLKKMESDFTSVRMMRLAESPIIGSFNFEHLCRMHEAIFRDVYEWAGSPRIVNIEKPEDALGGLSIEYAECGRIQREADAALSKMNGMQWGGLPLEQKSVRFSECMADLWKVHPFREGNTRTTVAFCCDFAESRGFAMDRMVFKDNSVYLRRALVAACAKFSDLGDLSKPEYLIRIVKDSMERGEAERTKGRTMSEWKSGIAAEKAESGGIIKPAAEKSHSGAYRGRC